MRWTTRSLAQLGKPPEIPLVLGGFENAEEIPFISTLQRFFGPDLEMEQTLDLFLPRKGKKHI